MDSEIKNFSENVHEKFVDVFSQAPIPISITEGPDHRFVFANDKYVSMFFPDENIIDKSVFEVAPESAAQGYLELMDTVYRTGKRHEGTEKKLELKRQGQSSKNYILNFVYQPVLDANEQVSGIMTVVTDVTSEVLARETLAEQKNRLYSILDRMPTALVLIDPESNKITFSNAATNKMFGFSLENTLPDQRYGDQVKIYSKKGNILGLTEIPSARLIRGEDLKDEEFYLETREGHFHLLMVSQVIQGSYGHGDSIMLMLKDISAVRNAEEQFTKFAELAPQMPFIGDPEGNIIYFSQKWYDYIGFHEAMTGWEWKDRQIHHPDDLQNAIDSWKHSVKTGEPYEIEYRLRRHDGIYRWHLGRASAIRDQNGKITKWYGTNTDIHEQKQLAESLSNAVNVADLGFWEYDLETSMMNWNEQLRAHFDFESEVFSASLESVFKKIDSRDIDKVQQGLQEAIESGQPYDIEFRIIHRDLTLVWLRAQGEVLFDLDGKPLRVTGTTLNITEHKVSQETISKSESKFRFLANSMPQIVWTARPDGVLNYVNQRWSEYSGSSDPEAWLSFVHPEDIQEITEQWIGCVASGAPYEAEFRIKRVLDSSYRWHLVRAVFVPGDLNVDTRWYGTCTDVTEQKILLAELNRAKNQAEIANHAKSSFLANMSHEIRTPLAAILGFTELLKEAKLLGSEKRYLEIIEKSGQSLTKLIDDILDLSKVEAGQVNIKRQDFSLPKLMTEVLDMFTEKTRAKGIYLRLDWQATKIDRVVSDPVRMRQILINLIGNAVKFTNKGGVTVSIQGRDISSGKAQIQIRVTDSGIGMSQEQSERIFQPFVQADNSTSRKFGGTGLGLALSRRLATALQGNVYVENCELGRGCTFVFQLELEPSVALFQVPVALPNPKDNKRPLRGKKVLVVDDSSDNRDLMQHFLTAEGADYAMANNGLEAIDQALKNEFDVILMDIQMPELDGYGALAALQLANYGKPVIALTAHALLEERKKALDAGFADHVSKPVNYNLLVQTILKYT